MRDEEFAKRFTLGLLLVVVALCAATVIAVKMDWIDQPQIGKISPPTLLPQ